MDCEKYQKALQSERQKHYELKKGNKENIAPDSSKKIRVNVISKVSQIPKARILSMNFT